MAARFNKGGGHCFGVGGEASAAGGKRDLEVEPPAAKNFLLFSHKKHSFQHTFLLKKDIPVPAVSADCSH